MILFYDLHDTFDNYYLKRHRHVRINTDKKAAKAASTASGEVR